MAKSSYIQQVFPTQVLCKIEPPIELQKKHMKNTLFTMDLKQYNEVCEAQKLNIIYEKTEELKLL